jgi:hypothetical protein
MAKMMETNKRTFVLGGILAAVLGIGMGWPVFMQPVRDAESDLYSAGNDLEDAEKDDYQLQLARKRNSDAMASSLPPSLNDAQRLYLEWITDLTQECNFAQSTVQPGGQQQRSGKFLLVSVVVEAESSLEDLSRFLFQFKQADLTHRITKLDVSSNGTSGKPRMEFTLTAEGMAVIGSDEKTELSARVPLTGPLDAESTKLTVEDAEPFPSRTPFVAKVGFETMRVTEIDDKTWTVERAVAGSDAQEHSESAVIRHFPVNWDRRERQFEDYASFLEQPLFSKPAVPQEYNPELAGVDDLTIAPGETASITARVDDYNTDLGEIEFSLEVAAEGITIDSETGQLQWETAGDQEPAEYKATIVALQSDNSEFKLQQAVTITVKLPNSAPELTITGSLVVLLGQEFSLTATATDDGEATDLSFVLEGESLPEGLALDSATGVLAWNPPLTFSPGTHTVEVKVTDKGDPAESASKSITIEVKDDDARYTNLTGIVRKDGRPEAWLENTRTNSRQTLHVGDEFTVANISAEVVDIAARFITFKDEDGIWQLGLGKLRGRILKSPAPAAENTEPVE